MVAKFLKTTCFANITITHSEKQNNILFSLFMESKHINKYIKQYVIILTITNNSL